MEEMGARLSKLRRDKNLNQEELAENLGVSRQAVSKWERGESTPDICNLIALSELYDVSIDYLARGLSQEDTQEGSSEEPQDCGNAQDNNDAAVIEAANNSESNQWPTPNPDSYVYVEHEASYAQPETVTVNSGKRRRSPLITFPYPVVIVLLYLFIGFVFDGWHPWWMLFLTIPVYYWVANVIIHDPEYIEDHPQYKSSRGDS